MVGPIILVGKTDASGRFEAIAPRGKEMFCHPDIPKGYLKLARGIEMPEITGDGQELPPIELERGVTLRGIVVDEEGKPVAGRGCSASGIRSARASRPPTAQPWLWDQTSQRP